MSQLVRLEGKHTYQNAHCAVAETRKRALLTSMTTLISNFCTTSAKMRPRGSFSTNPKARGCSTTTRTTRRGSPGRPRTRWDTWRSSPRHPASLSARMRSPSSWGCWSTSCKNKALWRSKWANRRKARMRKTEKSLNPLSGTTPHPWSKIADQPFAVIDLFARDIIQLINDNVQSPCNKSDWKIVIVDVNKIPLYFMFLKKHGFCCSSYNRN